MYRPRITKSCGHLQRSTGAGAPADSKFLILFIKSQIGEGARTVLRKRCKTVFACFLLFDCLSQPTV